MTEASATALKPAGISRSVSALLYMVQITTWSGLGALYAFMPAVGRELDVADALIASTASLSSLIWFLVAPLWSSASDRIGRKAIILVGCAGLAGSSALTSLAIHVGMMGWIAPMTAFVAIVGSRCVMGLFGFTSGPASQAFIADHTSPADRTRALSMLGSAQGLGSILGPAAAPFMILPLLGLAGPMFFFFVIGTVMLVLAWVMIPPDRPANVAPRVSQTLLQRLGLRGGFWGDPTVGPFVWCSLWLGAVSIVNAQVIGFMIIDVTGLPPMRAQVYTAYVLMGGAIVSVLAQSAIIPMFKLKPNRLIWVGLMIAILGNAVLVFSHAVAPAAVGFAVASLGYAFIRPGITAGASLAASKARQGEVAGVIASSGIAGVIFAPIIALSIYQGWRDGPYLINALALVAVLVFVRAKAPLRNAGATA